MFSNIPSVDEKIEHVLNETVRKGFTEDNFDTLLFIAENQALEAMFGLKDIPSSNKQVFRRGIASAERISTTATANNVVFI